MVNTPRASRDWTARSHILSGPPLHPNPLIDKLSRVYVYTVFYLDPHLGTPPDESEAAPGGHPRSPAHFKRWLAERAAGLPHVFRIYLQHPGSFEELEETALRRFVAGLPPWISSWSLDEALQSVTDVLRWPGIPELRLGEGEDTRILELPGSMGRYASLLCRAHPQLRFETNCTVVCRDHLAFRKGALEVTVAGAQALLAGAGWRERPEILQRPLAELGGSREFDLILGPRSVLEERRPGWEVDSGMLERLLTPGGKLILLDLPPVRI